MTRLSNLIQHVQEALEYKQMPKNADPNQEPTSRMKVIEAVLRRGKPANTDDLPSMMEEMTAFFEEFKNSDYFVDYSSEDYYRFLDLRDKPQARVVVIGDIHCDYYALSALLLKLSVSSYDYFENAFFVFLGDYLDRGSALFEPLLLLMDLKRILGDRMIMLRGNHELIDYDEIGQKLESKVIPQDSCPVLNEYCGDNKDFLKAFGYFYKTLPTYVYLKVADQNVLLTHGAVPRQIFLDSFSFNQTNGSMEFDSKYLCDQTREARQETADDLLSSMTRILTSNLLRTRNKILNDMIWGDPSTDKEKYQVSGRYQFGSSQFEAYAQKNNISRMFRSHEPVDFGYESFFDNRLYTVFSTGGALNDQAGYGDINPAFAVVKNDGSYFIENSFIYKMELCETVPVICNLFSEDVLNFKQSSICSVNDEFICDGQMALEVESVFSRLKDSFNAPEENDEAESEAPVAEEPETPEKAETPEEPETLKELEMPEEPEEKCANPEE